MKKGILIVIGMFMMVSSVEANNGSNLTNRFGINFYAYDNAVNFFERGIEFFVFTNGDFDFDTSFANRGVRIQRDFNGQIRRIGNVFINYDFRGNVTRIGNIFMQYRRNRLVRVGNLNVRYDRWGYPIFYGNVYDDYYFDNGVRININIGRIFDFNDRFFFRNDFNRNYTRFREDRNFYYYKANKNARVGKNEQIIRRRKSASDNRNDYIRRNDNVRGNDNNRRNDNVRRNDDGRRGNMQSYRKPQRTERFENKDRKEIERNSRSNDVKKDLRKKEKEDNKIDRKRRS